MQGCSGSQVCARTHNTLKTPATPVQREHPHGAGDLQRFLLCILLSAFALAACQGTDQNADRCATGDDIDGDGIADVCDDDIDGDQRLNDDDLCPTSTVCPADLDGDNIANEQDACPDIADDQADLDQDTIGDACDSDVDGDGIDNDVDNCPRTSNTSQTDVDADNIGDACDIRVSPFSLDQVTLLESPFTENRDRTLAYLAFIDADRMLYTFRQNVGLSSTARPVGGWEAPEHGLRGHSMGHIITALSQAYLSTGDVQYKNKADYIVTELKKCQDRSPAVGYSEGYLSAFPEERVFQLERLQTTWAPLYCIHKTIAGLLDAYQMLNNNEALAMAIKMADWIYNRLGQYSHQHLQNMWNFMNWNAGEYGGFNETLAEIYNITKDPKHIDAARFFDHDVLFDPLSNNRDRLNGMHANTQIPKIIGALRIYDATNEGYYYAVADNFWEIVVNHHSYINGGNSLAELFRGPDRIASQLTAQTTETCNTYNMLKLTRQLYFHDPQPKYMDYYERALYNHILASQNPASDHGFMTYFVPMQPGGIRTYSTDYDSFWCCHGTGMENHTKYQDSIYAHTDNTLYVNLFIPSVLNWTERGFTIRQEGSFLTDESATLIVQGSGQLEIKIRVPSWVDSGFVLKVNNIAQSITASPGTYISLDRTWSNGDSITIETPFSLRMERTPDNDRVGGVMYGPILLAGDHDGDDVNGVMQLIDVQSATDITDVIQPGLTPLSFVVPTADSLALIPFYKAHGIHYSTYFYLDNSVP